MPSEKDPDENLIRQAQNGSSEAFNSLVRRHQEAICRITYRWVGNMEEARDIAQEVFLEAYHVIPRWKYKAKFFTWLYQTAFNMARSSRRKINKMGQWRNNSDLNNYYHEKSAGADITHEETKDEIFRAVSNLPERQRQVVLLRIYEQLSIQDTAKIMRCKEGTVKALLYQALQRLSIDLPKEEVDGQVQT